MRATWTSRTRTSVRRLRRFTGSSSHRRPMQTRPLPREARMNREFGGRRVRTFGAGGPVIWMVCDFDLAAQVSDLLPEGAATVAAVEGVDWNCELTPWPAPPVARGQPDFGGGADALLGELAGRILPEVEAELRPSARWIAGYSLAGLFAVYAALSTRLFARVASVSRLNVVSRIFGFGRGGRAFIEEGAAAQGVRPEMPSVWMFHSGIGQRRNVRAVSVGARVLLRRRPRAVRAEPCVSHRRGRCPAHRRRARCLWRAHPL